jgi:hypothetical protein
MNTRSTDLWLALAFLFITLNLLLNQRDKPLSVGLLLVAFVAFSIASINYFRAGRDVCVHPKNNTNSDNDSPPER